MSVTSEVKLQDRFTEIAHEAWCLQQLEIGWTEGKSYDPERRTHDALRPFADLDSIDQRDARHAALGLISIRDLAGAVRYHRGPDQEFRPDELTKGLRVQSVDDGREGELASWTLSPDGRFVEWINVVWDDGTELRTHASERSLSRLGADSH